MALQKVSDGEEKDLYIDLEQIAAIAKGDGYVDYFLWLKGNHDSFGITKEQFKVIVHLMK